MTNRPSLKNRLEAALIARFGGVPTIDPALAGIEELVRISEHHSHRSYDDRAIAPELLELLFACAPSKSDLQQADIIFIKDRAKITQIVDLIPEMPWIGIAPVVLIFCGNNRRIRQIAEWRGKPFSNDHLDHFMNAAVDAGIVMTTFIRAAEAVGLGCCPISAVRNHPDQMSELLSLPANVFPVAGLTLGWPATEGRITPRLPMDVTAHVDAFGESDVQGKVEAHDRRRHEFSPYQTQKAVETWGKAPFYGWSEDKARQYGRPGRAGFGDFIRRKGFSLD